MRVIVLLSLVILFSSHASGGTISTSFNCPGPGPTPDCDARAMITGLGTNTVTVVAGAGDDSNGLVNFGRSSGALASLYAVTLGPTRPGWLTYRGAVDGDGTFGASASATVTFGAQQCSAGLPFHCSIGDLASYLPVQLGAGGDVFFASASASANSLPSMFPSGAGYQGSVMMTLFEFDRTTPVPIYDRDTVATIPESGSGLLIGAGLTCLMLGAYHRQSTRFHGETRPTD